MNIRYTRLISKKFGSKKGMIRHYYYKMRYVFGDRFGTNNVSSNQVKRIVFVCKGNICRSAYAEGVGRKKSAFMFASFGLDTKSAKPVNERIGLMASNRGVDLSSHKTTAIEDFSPKPGDLFVCMEPTQCLQLRAYYPFATVTLIGFWGRHIRPYLHDPYCASDKYVTFCLDYLELAVEQLIHNLKIEI